jgi:hypothetical protein
MLASNSKTSFDQCPGGQQLNIFSQDIVLVGSTHPRQPGQ